MAYKTVFYFIVAVNIILLFLSLTQATSDCELPKDIGTCDKKYRSFYFDMKTRHCRPFIWSGCGGNGNKFFSREECRFACHYYMKLKPSGFLVRNGNQ
ncbi:hypothetical protein evm_001515 [Chilo suppressalis]|nr:hypothetical protein evm_001515 [Chilo suppressalis]